MQKGRKRIRLLPQLRRPALEAGWKFFRQWIRSPREMSSLSPSSRELARKMIDEMLKSTRRVIELGGGTGAFTRALLAFGIEPEDLLVLELNQTLSTHLKQVFPGVRVECADAADLEGVAARSGWTEGGKADAVICGLGLLAMSPAAQRAVLDAAFALLAANGRFVLFTYGPANPIARDVMLELNLGARRGGFTLKNLPPATVYVLTRNRSKRVAPKARSH